MRRSLCVLGVVLSCLVAAQAVSAQVSTVQFSGSYRGFYPYADWAWWLTPAQRCAETQPFYGAEPAAPGRYPVLIYLHSTLADWSNNVEGRNFVALAATYGFVAVAFSYDSWSTYWNAVDIDRHAICMFSASNPGNGIAQICARPEADCSNGFVLAGFSQGGAIAMRVENFNSGVQKVWAMGAGTTLVPGALTTPAGTRVLPNNDLRITIGQAEIPTTPAGQPNLSVLNAATGQSCTTFNCIQADGSGYYVVSNAEVSSGVASHCLWFLNATCSLSPTFDPTFVNGTTPWSLSTNLAFLSGQLSVPGIQTGSSVASAGAGVVRPPSVQAQPVVLTAARKLAALRMRLPAYARAHAANVNQLLNR